MPDRPMLCFAGQARLLSSRLGIPPPGESEYHAPSPWQGGSGVRVMDPSERTKRSRELRQSATRAETALWGSLRNRHMSDWKWRRQQPIGPYFADFACKEALLVVELDGSQHGEADGREYDEERTAYMEAQGWRVLRFSNRDVLLDIARVLEVILRALKHPHPDPLPARERELERTSSDVTPNQYGWRHVSPQPGRRTPW